MRTADRPVGTRTDPERPTVLYLTYWGLASPLGTALCVPPIRRLASEGRARPLVISFETDPLPTTALRARLLAAGVTWVDLRYHGRPAGAAKVYDIAAAVLHGLRLIRRHQVDVIHARSYVAAAAAAVLARVTGLPWIFDMLGMLADEYADAGHWDRSGLFYRVTKQAERRLLRDATAVIVLTERSAEHLRTTGAVARETPLVVVPCAVDLSRFRCDASADAFPRDGPPRLVYSGSIGTWYMLDEMLDLFAAAKRCTPGTVMRILSRSDRDVVRRAAAARGIAASDLELISAHPDDVPRLLCECDVGVCFIRPSFSKDAASPTKVGEYLASGLPVIANRGVGDLDRVLADAAGELVDAHDAAAYARAWTAVTDRLRAGAAGTREACRAVASEAFSLDRTVRTYAELYAVVRRRDGPR